MRVVKSPSILGRAALLGLLAATLACARGPKDEAAETADLAPVPSPAADSSAESVEASGPEVPKITPFGVPECDAYVQRYLDCLETKVSDEEKDRLMQGFEANRTRWRALATMREGALALGLACKAAAQKAKEELSVDYGCEF
jgi:hypothetical protein